MTLKDQPIRRKLMTVILLTSSTVSLLTCVAFITYEWTTFRREMVRNLTTLADLTAANSTAALAFKDEPHANQVLLSLRVEEHIVAACLYDDEGRLFVKYPGTGSAAAFPSTPEKDGHRFTESHLMLFQPVRENGERLGTLYLKSDLNAMFERLQLYAEISILVLAGSFLVAFAISSTLQKRISQPILALAETAKVISSRKDFSVRARKIGQDELGLLTDAFNQMLIEIQERDSALRESEARKGAILESALDGIIGIDHQGRTTEFNPAAQQIFGYSRDQMIGKGIADVLISPALRERDRRGMAHYLATGKGPVLGQRIEMTALRANGAEFPVELSISRIGSDEPPTFTSFVRDITERKQTEARREELLRELEAKNAEMERFTYAVSHDLKSPIITIKSFLGMVEQDAQAGRLDRIHGDLRRIGKAADQMVSLLDELLKLSRLGRVVNPPEDVPLHELAREAVELVAGRINARGVNVIIQPDLPVVRCDRGRLLQVLQNLVDNAVKFMGDQPSPRIVIGAQRQEAEIHFFVRDNGVGIEAKYQSKIFGLFDKLESKSEGSGVGLALVKRIIELHGGRIWVESTGAGLGTIFWFTLGQNKEFSGGV